MTSKPNEKTRIYELVIYGATGFTGKYAVEEMAKYVNAKKIDIKWAVAGRNRSKLESVLDEVAELIGNIKLNIYIVCYYRYVII